MKWNELSLKEKAELMKLYVSNGITKLDDIITHYNAYQEGGKITFEQWKQQMQQLYPDIEMDNNRAGYDYNAYFNNNYNAAIAQLTNLQHFPDTYKLPNHPTFSNESIYHNYPTGNIGGKWVYSKPWETRWGGTDAFIPSDANYKNHPEIYKEDRPYTEREIYKPQFVQSSEQYYDKDNDIIYSNSFDGEGYQHEYFHARPNTTLLNNLRPYYENLNDSRLTELGADLPFVKRVENDPNHFYSPEELGARVSAARYMLNKAGINNIDIDFLRNARKNELQYGDNFRDLLHMYNDENLLQILNIQYSKGGSLGKVTPYGQWEYPHQVTTIPSNNITMKGVDYPVLGISDTGDTKYMLPNMDYLFDGNYVTEYPLHKFQKGGYTTNGITLADGRTLYPISDLPAEDTPTSLPAARMNLKPIVVKAKHPLWDLPDYQGKEDNPNINAHKDELYQNRRRREEAGKEYLKNIGRVGLTIGTLPILGYGAITAPLATGLSLAVGEGLNYGIKKLTPYDSWGNMLAEGVFNTDNELTQTALEFTNPGFLLGLKAAPFVNNQYRGLRIANELRKGIRNTELQPRIAKNTAHTRTKLGDVEVDDPNLMYHVDNGDYTGFSDNGAYVKDGMLFPSQHSNGQKPYTWWNLGSPYRNGQTRLLTTTKDNPSLLRVRDQDYPIGQWTGNPKDRTFVTNQEFVSSNPIKIGNQYVWEPGYGYRKYSTNSNTLPLKDVLGTKISLTHAYHREYLEQLVSSKHKSLIIPSTADTPIEWRDDPVLFLDNSILKKYPHQSYLGDGETNTVNGVWRKRSKNLTDYSIEELQNHIDDNIGLVKTSYLPEESHPATDNEVLFNSRLRRYTELNNPKMYKGVDTYDEVHFHSPIPVKHVKYAFVSNKADLPYFDELGIKTNFDFYGDEGYDLQKFREWILNNDNEVAFKDGGKIFYQTRESW